MRRLVLLCATLTFLLPHPGAAQESDGGFISNFLENTLSGDNRNVAVTGLEGALSSRATIKEVQVSDDEGVWLILRDLVLDWNRLALVRGRFSVNELSASAVEVLRKPGTTTSDDAPTPEATPFALPELPVAVLVETVEVKHLLLAEPVAGIEADLALAGHFSLSDGVLDTDISAHRLDRTTDTFDLKAGYSNESKELQLDLVLKETGDGLLSTVMGIPGQPDLNLTIKGDGPLSDLTTEILLATDGVPRLSGRVDLLAGATPEDPLSFDAGLSGDIRALMEPAYHQFFGADTRFDLLGNSYPDGRVKIGTLAVQSEALTLRGALALDAQKRPEKLYLQAAIGSKDSASVVLPVPGADTMLDRAHLSAVMDKSVSENWKVDMSVLGVSHPDFDVRDLHLKLDGLLSTTGGSSGDVTAVLDGLTLKDENLQQAAGDQVTLKGGFSTAGSDKLTLSNMTLAGDGMHIVVDGTIDGLSSGFEMDGRATLNLADLSRFAGLANRPLGGALQASLAGSGSPLSGMFDLTLDGRGSDLALGQDQLDPLLVGDTDLVVSAKRDTTGIALEHLVLDGRYLRARATGEAQSGATNMDVSAGLSDLSLVVPDMHGPLNLTAKLRHEGQKLTGTADLTGPDAEASLSGQTTIDGQTASVSFDARMGHLERVVKQLSGTGRLKGSLNKSGQTVTGNVRLDGPHQSYASAEGSIALDLSAADLTLDALLADPERFVPGFDGPLELTGQLKQDGSILNGALDLNAPNTSQAHLKGQYHTETGVADVTFDGQLGALERFLPQAAGTLSAKGTANRKSETWTIAADAKGPAGIDVVIGGTYGETSGEADMTARGSGLLGVVNRFIAPIAVDGRYNFDLALRGKPSLEALSGNVTASGGALTIPQVRNGLNGLTAQVNINNGSAQVDASGEVKTGGRLSVRGPIKMSPPFDGTLDIGLTQIGLTDNVSFESSADGALRLVGPLLSAPNLSGQINIGETEVNIAAASGAPGVAPIPEITHVGESGAVKATRSYAGLVSSGDNGEGGGGPVIGLDLRISAPNKIFVRGRGLDSELGGMITIKGTSVDPRPAGQIELIRGRLDIFGRRLDLAKGLITLQGNLQPYIEFLATTTTSEGEASLEVTGTLDKPEINVYSDPERPTEEALALLVFGNEFSQLSPLKIAQLATSLARLAGHGTGAAKSLREGLGVDSVDLTTDADGNAQVGVGGYLSGKVYSDVSVNALGETELNLNLDVTNHLKLRGSVDSGSDTSLGIFFEKDY